MNTERERERTESYWSNDHIGKKLTVTKLSWICVYTNLTQIYTNIEHYKYSKLLIYIAYTYLKINYMTF